MFVLGYDVCYFFEVFLVCRNIADVSDGRFREFFIDIRCSTDAFKEKQDDEEQDKTNHKYCERRAVPDNGKCGKNTNAKRNNSVQDTLLFEIEAKGKKHKD